MRRVLSRVSKKSVSNGLIEHVIWLRFWDTTQIGVQDELGLQLVL
jgi:hypothetical protein